MIETEIDWIDRLRAAELELVLHRLPWLKGELLEIGGGSGRQAALLAGRGLTVTAIDLASSSYRGVRSFPIVEYDGVHIPFAAERFDVVFSSNTLEHIAALDAFEREMRRVLRPGGRAVHVLPTHWWRLWSSLAHYPGILALLARRGMPGPASDPTAPPRRPSELLMKVLVPPRHGERGSIWSEHRYFHPRWWTRHFAASGWRVVDSFDIGLFYTGYMILSARMPLAVRQRLGHMLGSATRCYVLEPAA